MQDSSRSGNLSTATVISRCRGDYIPPEIEIIAVQYPGRGSRATERPKTSIHDLVQDLLDNIHSYLSEKPFFLFGHSLGGIVAFEVSRELQRRKLGMPLKLFIGDAV